jgi:hypothetical protein
MTNRYPLIIDAATQRIRELPQGDNLDLTGNDINSVRNIIPEIDSSYDLGSTVKRWKDLYLSGNSIYLGSGVISFDEDLEVFNFSKAISLSGTTTDSLTEGTSNLFFTVDRARTAISVSDQGGDGALSYNNETGVITYTGPSATEVRSYFSAGTGVTLEDGQISIGQSVSQTDNVVFNSVEVSDSITTASNSVDIVNSVATTVNFAGEAVEISIGSNTGNTTVNNNLVISGSLSSQGTVLTEGSGIDQITVFTKAITLSQDWQDTGINSSELATGTYFVQLYANDIAAGGTNNNEYYSGIMSWYAGETDSAVELPTDEIVLHRAGASADAGLYLRTFRSMIGDSNNLKLQLYSNYSNSSSSNYVFKFRRVI